MSENQQTPIVNPVIAEAVKTLPTVPLTIPTPQVQQNPPQSNGPKMPTCSCWVKLNKEGSNVLKNNVTPAEMFFLVAEHHVHAGGDPIGEMSNETTIVRTDRQEFDRLCALYHPDKIRALFPGPIPNLVKTFAEAREIGVKISLSDKKLVQHSIR